MTKIPPLDQVIFAQRITLAARSAVAARVEPDDDESWAAELDGQGGHLPT